MIEAAAQCHIIYGKNKIKLNIFDHKDPSNQLYKDENSFMPTMIKKMCYKIYAQNIKRQKKEARNSSDIAWHAQVYNLAHINIHMCMIMDFMCSAV